MVLAIVLISWAVVSVLTAVIFAAVGRAAFREDQALGYLQPEPRVSRMDDPEPEDAARPVEPARREVVRSSASR